MPEHPLRAGDEYTHRLKLEVGKSEGGDDLHDPEEEVDLHGPVFEKDSLGTAAFVLDMDQVEVAKYAVEHVQQRNPELGVLDGSRGHDRVDGVANRERPQRDGDELVEKRYAVVRQVSAVAGRLF